MTERSVAFKQRWADGLCSLLILPPFLHQQPQQQGVDVMWQHQEGQHSAGEEALHSDAEPGSSARQRLPQHEAGLLQRW